MPEEWVPEGQDLLLRGGVTVAECSTSQDAAILAYVLKKQNIDCAVFAPFGRYDRRYPQLKVAPDDEARARLILSQPVSTKLREDYEREQAEEPEPLPACPACGSDEILLDSVDDANHWRCDACGHSWTDGESEPA